MARAGGRWIFIIDTHSSHVKLSAGALLTLKGSCTTASPLPAHAFHAQSYHIVQCCAGRARQHAHMNDECVVDNRKPFYSNFDKTIILSYKSFRQVPSIQENARVIFLMHRHINDTYWHSMSAKEMGHFLVGRNAFAVEIKRKENTLGEPAKIGISEVRLHEKIIINN